MITTFYPPYSFGGDAIFVRNLSRALAARGHEVDVIHCVDSFVAVARRAGLPSAPVPAAADAGIKVHALRSAFGPLSPTATYFTGLPTFKFGAIEAILRAKPFDVIHFHNISLIGGPGILKLGSGVKLYTLHEHWLVCPVHTLFKFDEKACDRRECVRCALHTGRPPQPWRYTGLVGRALRAVDAVLCPSLSVMRKHQEGGIEAPYVHLPSAVNDAAAQIPDDSSAEFVRAQLPRPFFLYCGRLEKLKGLQTVIPVFLRRTGADLAVAGGGSYEQELRAAAAGCERVRFLGAVDPARLRALYRAAIAVVVPSLTYEITPLIIPESAAQHTPVIVRDLGPMPDLVRASGGGLIFRDEASLAAAMDRVQEDPNLRNALGEAGYDYYRREWSEAIHVERYLRLIGEIHARRKLGSS